MTPTKKTFIAFVLGMLSISLAFAQEIPPLSGRINDRAGLLVPGVRNELEQYLAAVEASSGAQIALLTLPSLGGNDLTSYSLRVVEEWQLGSSEADNGVLLLIAIDERKVRIETGYGLEGLLTDAISSYIIREIMAPPFRVGDFDSGITAALHAIGGIVTEDAPIDAAVIAGSQQRSRGTGIPVFFLLFMLLSLLGRMGRIGRYRHHRGASPVGAFVAGSVLASSMRRRGGGGFGGGGFGGGGGGFGGGGASGGW